jgi:hypothetical protein
MNRDQQEMLRENRDKARATFRPPLAAVSNRGCLSTLPLRSHRRRAAT